MFKRLSSFFFAVFMVISIFSLQAGAKNNESSDKVLVQGGLTEEEKNMTNEDFLNQALSRPGITKEEQQKIIEKDKEAKQILQKKIAESQNVVNDDGTIVRAPTATFALLVTPCKQETNSWCSAATIKQTLRYINGSCSTSQQSIMNSVGAGPGLQTVLNYINARISLPDYYKVHVANRTEFDALLDYDVTHYQPMVFTLKNRKGIDYWPYQTYGHFTNCDVYLYGEYLISDPFYFLDYVASATSDNGYHYEPWWKVWDVNTQLFGSGNNHVGY